MDSLKIFHVGVLLKYPTVSPLSLWERARVRAFERATPISRE
jgi:hypothetical protein